MAAHQCHARKSRLILGPCSTMNRFLQMVSPNNEKRKTKQVSSSAHLLEPLCFLRASLLNCYRPHSAELPPRPLPARIVPALSSRSWARIMGIVCCYAMAEITAEHSPLGLMVSVPQVISDFGPRLLSATLAFAKDASDGTGFRSHYRRIRRFGQLWASDASRMVH